MARSRYTVSLVFLTFFVISLLTNILGPIVPDNPLLRVAGGEEHCAFKFDAGILGTGIIGGAVVPVIIGRIGDFAGLRSGVAFL
jgi:FHS family L-fucose permease-like MFS transporter